MALRGSNIGGEGQLGGSLIRRTRPAPQTEEEEPELAPLSPFDEDAAEVQRLLQRYDSQAQVGEDYAALRREQARDQAISTANKILERDPEGLSSSERETLASIAETGQTPVNRNFLIDTLDALDRIGGVVRLGVLDVFGKDEDKGREIRGRDYINMIRGHDASLRRDLGTDLIGEDARASGGKILESFGYEEAEGLPGKILRGVADFGLEVLLDPTTYVTFGLSAVGKKAALEAVQSTTTRYVRRAITANSLDDLDTPLTRGIRQAFEDDFDRIVARKEDELLEAVGDITPDDMLLLRQEAIEEAEFNAHRTLTNEVGSAVVDREFSKLPQDYIDEVLRDPQAPNWLTGGMRAVLPKALGGGGITAGVAVPGSRGLGRSATNKLFRDRGWYNRIKESSIGRALRSIKNSLAGEQASISAARNGRLYEFLSGPTEWRKVSSELGIREITTSLGAEAHRINKLAHDAGEDTQIVLRTLVDYIESREPPAGQLFASRELDTAARQFIGGAIDALDTVFNTMQRYDPDLSGIARYVPRIMTDRGMKALARLAEEGVAIDTSTRGGQLLSQYLATFGRGARGPSSVGEAVFQQTREIGRSALIPAVEDTRYMLVNRHLVESGSFLSIDQMNLDLTRAIRETMERNSIAFKLDDEFRMFDNDPLNLLTKYFQGMSASLEQRVLVSQWKKVGLVRQADRAVDLQRVNDQIAKRFFEEGGIDRLTQVIRRVEERVDNLVGDVDIPTEQIDLGQGVKVNLPEGAVDASKRLRNAIESTRIKAHKAAERYDAILAARRRETAQLVSQGVSEEMALEMVAARPDEITDLLDNLWVESIAGLDEELAALTERLSMESAEEFARHTRVHQAAIDHARQARREIADQRREMRRQWNDRYRGKTIVEPREEVAHVVLNDAERQALARMIRTSHGRIVEENLDRLLSTFPPEMVARMKRALFEGDGSLIGETKSEMQDWLVENEARTSGEWIRDIFARAVDEGMDPALLPSEATLRRVASGETSKSNALLEALGRAVVGLQSEFLSDELRVARLSHLRDEFQELVEGGMDAADAYRQVARDSYIRAAQDRLTTNARIAADPLNRLESTINGLQVGQRRVLEALDDPRLFQNENVRNEFYGLLQLLGGDPNDWEVLADGTIRKLARTTTVGAEFPTVQEILKAIKDADLSSAREALDNLNRLPDNIAAALTHEGVPQHIDMHSQLTRTMASARAAERRAGRSIKGMDAVNRAEGLWTTKVLPHMRQVLSGKKSAVSFRKLFYSIDKADGAQRLTDLGKELKRGLPGEIWDRITHTARHLEAIETTKVDRRLLAQNKSLMEGKVFRPLSESIEGMAEWATHVRGQLDDAELERMGSYLDQAQEFIDTMLGEFLFEANRAADGVPGLFPYHSVLASNEQVRRLGELRQLGAKLGLDEEDLAALKPVSATLSTEGFRPVKEVGVGGEILQGQVARPEVNLFLENMAANLRRSYTPEGLEKLGDGARSFLSGYWKGAATVARPTFHIRNIIGAAWNNQIVDVGAREYAALGGWPTKFLHGLRAGDDLDTALGKLPARLRPSFRAMAEEGVFESSFAITEFRKVSASRGVSLNPFNEDFLPFRAGGVAMESIEAQARAAVFYKYFDEADPDSAGFARALVNAVHFDYQDLTRVEEAVKTFVPFFVWTRRNIPLQLQTMLERPGIAMRYPHLAHSVEDQWSGEQEADLYARSPYLSGYAAETGVVLDENTPFWARLILDPDIPLKNILEEDPMSWEGIFNLVTNSLGPQFTTPFQIREQAEFGPVNAPHGMKEILQALDAIGFYDADTTTAGDVRIPYAVRSVVETGIPFQTEYLGLTAGDTDPRRRQRAGLGEGDRWWQQAASTLGKGLGVTFQTPGDTLSTAFEAEQFATDIEAQKKLEGLNLETVEDSALIVEQILADLELGERPDPSTIQLPE